MGVLSVRYTDRLAARFVARVTLIAGLALIVAALLLFAQAPVHGGYAIHDLPVMLLMGAGAGLAFPALMTVAMAGATPADAGLASGLVNTTALVGGALGLAALATVSAGRTSNRCGNPPSAARRSSCWGRGCLTPVSRSSRSPRMPTGSGSTRCAGSSWAWRRSR
jgi:MFS family permease